MSHPIITYNFCPQCGKPLIQGQFSKQNYPYCPDCSFVHWGEFSLGVGGIVWRENKVLLVQRAQNPGKGNWTIPGGFVDQRERISEAIVRELQEETGLETEPVSLIALRDRPGNKHDLYMVFILRYIAGELQPELEEVSQIGFFTIEECRKLPLAHLSLSVIEASQTQLSGFIPVHGIQLIGEKSVLYQVPTPIRQDI
ncbi:NUDIX domain-containing protein [Desulfitobacterium metallireducens]|uniref:NUDIX hydrolase n=1 Tax=Desulfitobacterium metallireducens DSM 15288 TaxID=871968 RepID=W0E8K6_9FIRM|nr:NUDIX domain-containing protein [Desulfitobacterium metallireducens]AHF05853.1 NUDIX hydrolase [Desulfitobacterium metallireducens DSM 15288]